MVSERPLDESMTERGDSIKNGNGSQKPRPIKILQT